MGHVALRNALYVAAILAQRGPVVGADGGSDPDAE